MILFFVYNINKECFDENIKESTVNLKNYFLLLIFFQINGEIR